MKPGLKKYIYLTLKYMQLSVRKDIKCHIDDLNIKHSYITESQLALPHCKNKKIYSQLTFSFATGN